MSTINAQGYVGCRAVYYKQNPRNSRRNLLPTERIDGPLLMRREPLTGALIELRQITHLPSRSHGVLHRPPEAFYRIEVVTAVGRQQRPRQLAAVVVEGRVELVRPLEPAAIHDHHHLCVDFTQDVQDLMEVLAACLGSTMGAELIDDA